MISYNHNYNQALKDNESLYRLNEEQLEKVADQASAHIEYLGSVEGEVFRADEVTAVSRWQRDLRNHIELVEKIKIARLNLGMKAFFNRLQGE